MGRGGEPRTRRAPGRRATGSRGGSSRGGWGAQFPYFVVLALAVGGVAWVWQGQQDVRAGTLTVAGGVFVAALARLVLAEGGGGERAPRPRLSWRGHTC